MLRRSRWARPIYPSTYTNQKSSRARTGWVTKGPCPNHHRRLPSWAPRPLRLEAAAHTVHRGPGPRHATPSPPSSDLSSSTKEGFRLRLRPGRLRARPPLHFPVASPRAAARRGGLLRSSPASSPRGGVRVPGTGETSTCAVTPALLDYLTLSLHSIYAVICYQHWSLRIWCCGFLLLSIGT